MTQPKKTLTEKNTNTGMRIRKWASAISKIKTQQITTGDLLYLLIMGGGDPAARKGDHIEFRKNLHDEFIPCIVSEGVRVEC